MIDPANRCCWPRCKSEYALHYLGRGLCKEHWLRVCELGDDGNAVELARKLGLPIERIKKTMETVK